MSEYKPTTLTTPPKPLPLIRSVFTPPNRSDTAPRAKGLPVVDGEGDREPGSSSTSSLSPSRDHGFRDLPTSFPSDMDSTGVATTASGTDRPQGITGTVPAMASQMGYPPPERPPVNNGNNQPPYAPPVSNQPPYDPVDSQPPYVPDGSEQPPPAPISYYHTVHQPSNFGGEKGENVEKFLITLKLSFLNLHIQIPNPVEREQIKLDILESYLVGRAYECWMAMNPANKATFDLASTALKRRFPRPNYDAARWNMRIKAQAEMDGLTQGHMTSDEYIEKANELYDTLGEEYALTLSTRFVDGINDRAVQVHVDTQTGGNYTSFQAVIRAYTIATTTIRRQEMAKRRNTVEPKQDLQQMVHSMGELFKGMMLNVAAPTQPTAGPATVVKDYPKASDFPKASDRRAYQPIVGAVHQQSDPPFYPARQEYPQPYVPSPPRQQPEPVPVQQYQPQYAPYRQSDRASYQQAQYQQSDRQNQPYRQRNDQGGQYGNTATYRGQTRRTRDVCFRCGQQGHRAFECNAQTPLPREEQDRLRNAQAQIYGGETRIPQTVACVDVTDEELGLVQDTTPAGTMLMSAKMVEIVRQEVKVEKGKGRGQGVTKMSTYWDELSEEDRACLLVAMAEKRMRAVEEVPDEAPQAQKQKLTSAQPYQNTRARAKVAQFPVAQPATTLVTSAPPVTGTVQAPVSTQNPVNPDPDTAPQVPNAPPVLPTIPQAPLPPPQASSTAPQWVPFVPDPRYNDPANWDPEFMPPTFEPSATKKNPKGRKKGANIPKAVSTVPKVPRHIKMVKGQPVWDPVEALRSMPVTGLDFGSLLDWSPGIRVVIGRAMQLEPDELQKGKKNSKPQVNDDGMVYAVQAVSTSTGITRGPVLPEPNVRVFNFHTTGVVWASWGVGTGYRIGKILIDGGAVVNLMPEKVATKLGLVLQENDDIVIRTATNEIRSIRYCTYFDIDIAGVVACIRAYVMDIPQSYSLLLGRKWLYQVKAFGDYERNLYVIHDTHGQPHTVKAVVDPINDSPEVMLNPRKQEGTELSAWEKEGIALGRSKMQAIITKVVKDAAEQSKEWINPNIEDDEELSGRDGEEEVAFEIVEGEVNELSEPEYDDLLDEEEVALVSGYSCETGKEIQH